MTNEKAEQWRRWCAAAAAVVVLAVAGAVANATVIEVDLTQTSADPWYAPNAGTWGWDGGAFFFTNMSFDLEFSSADGNDIDLDGGTAAGRARYTGSEATSNHTHDIIRATYWTDDVWKIEAVRGSTTYALGEVTEFQGTASHAVNYDYDNDSPPGYSSDPAAGPPEAGVNGSGQSQYWSWFWLYRDTDDDTISLNLVVGSANVNGADGGTLGDDVTVSFSGSYIGTPSILVENDLISNEITGSAPTFTANWAWPSDKDDGGVFGGIEPVPTIPEPGTALLVALGLAALAGARRLGVVH